MPHKHGAKRSRGDPPAVTLAKQGTKLPTRPFGLSGRGVRIATITLVIVATSLAVVVRFIDLGKAPFWRDEATSAFWASLAPAALLERLQHDVHAPLYYLLLGAWMRLFGGSEFALRSFGALLAGFTPALLYWAVAPSLGRAAGVCAAFILALNPGHILYAQQLGPYPLQLLLIVLSLGLLDRAGGGSRLAIVGLAVSLAALAYTHMWSLLVWTAIGVAIGGIALFSLIRRRSLPRIVWTYAIAQSGAVLLATPWLWTSFRQAGTRTMDHLPPTPGPFEMVAQCTSVWFLDPTESWLVGGGVAAFLIGGYWWLRRTPDAARATTFALTAISILTVPLVVCLLVGPVKTLFYSRYALVSVPALAVLLGFVAARVPLGIGPPLITAVLVLTPLQNGLKTGLTLASTMYMDSPLRAAAKHVQESAAPGDVIIIYPEIYAPTFNWYYRGDLPEVCFPAVGRVELVDYASFADRIEDPTAPRRAAEYVRDHLRPGGRIWAFYNPTYKGAHSKINYGDAMKQFLAALDAAVPTRKREVRDFYTTDRALVLVRSAKPGARVPQPREAVILTICEPLGPITQASGE